MPLYEYRCQSCGKLLEVLQKISEPPRTECPSCGQSALVKQLTAAGFQLKGTGWYATDFRGGTASAAAETDASTSKAVAGAESAASGEGKPSSDSAVTKPPAAETSSAKPVPPAAAS